jgi:hypothetical protein
MEAEVGGAFRNKLWYRHVLTLPFVVPSGLHSLESLADRGAPGQASGVGTIEGPLCQLVVATLWV